VPRPATVNGSKFKWGRTQTKQLHHLPCSYLTSRSWSLVGNAVKVCHDVGIQNTASYKSITACNTAPGLDHGRKVSYLHSGSTSAVPLRISAAIWTTRSQIFGSRDISVGARVNPVLGESRSDYHYFPR
jgi:hypothetical protein